MQKVPLGLFERIREGIGNGITDAVYRKNILPSALSCRKLGQHDVGTLLKVVRRG